MDETEIDLIKNSRPQFSLESGLSPGVLAVHFIGMLTLVTCEAESENVPFYLLSYTLRYLFCLNRL